MHRQRRRAIRQDRCPYFTFPRRRPSSFRTFCTPASRTSNEPKGKTRLTVNFHKHGSKNIVLVPRVLRVVPPEVRDELVQEGLAWLEENWQGDVDVPDELLPLVAAV
jgi:hypothetical protein